METVQSLKTLVNCSGSSNGIFICLAQSQAESLQNSVVNVFNKRTIMLIKHFKCTITKKQFSMICNFSCGKVRKYS